MLNHPNVVGLEESLRLDTGAVVARQQIEKEKVALKILHATRDDSASRR